MLLMTAANKVTSGRFLLTIVFFALLSLVPEQVADRKDPTLLWVAFALFNVIAWTDLLDGYLARKYGEVTHFGRIADPLVDKILVCGSFLYFLRIEPLPGYFPAWFVVVILAREFLVSGVRAAAEAAGIPFGATFWGKQKTLVQNATVGTGIAFAAHFVGTRWTELLTYSLMWLALVSTVVSGGAYGVQGWKLLRSRKV
jgi:CDP-diacylglycerol--glycerol-3-phosphate 3-phosphatidyltransferase